MGRQPQVQDAHKLSCSDIQWSLSILGELVPEPPTDNKIPRVLKSLILNGGVSVGSTSIDTED